MPIHESYIEDDAVEVEYDFVPASRETRDCPGYPAEVFFRGYWCNKMWFDTYSEDQRNLDRWKEEIIEAEAIKDHESYEYPEEDGR